MMSVTEQHDLRRFFHHAQLDGDNRQTKASTINVDAFLCIVKMVAFSILFYHSVISSRKLWYNLPLR